MENTMQIFENDEFGKIEVLMIDDKPYFSATECAATLGYQTPRHAITRHCKGGMKRAVVTSTTNQHGFTSEQTVEKTFIPEGDLYRLIARSKLPSAEKFERWVFDEVLPSTRKHGAYITDEVLRRLREDSEFADILVERLTAEKMKNHTLSNQIRQITPKAHYYDLILQNPDAVQVSIIAKDYGMTATAFNKLLHALGVQYRVGSTWLLYAEHAGKGYTITRTYHVNSYTTAIWTCFTQHGRLGLYSLLKWHGIVPTVEKPVSVCS